MAAFYDSYDYEAYWEKREYEHKSEVIAIKGFLNEIPHIDKILEVGGGFGRLVPSYAYRAKKIILTDPSAKILTIARKNLKDVKTVEYVQSTLENLPHKLRARSVDLIMMVRVLHHVTNTAKAFQIVARLLKNNGYFILEFANKRHIKATFSEVTKGNFEYLKDETPIDVRSAKSIRNKTIPFTNYHPSLIENQLKAAGLEIVDRLSVSNIRLPAIKKYISLETLLTIEKYLQKPLSQFNFGPSIFILARKRG